MEWNQFIMYEEDPSDSSTWVSGIYKIRSYSPGRFYAYYMRDDDKNWGWNVSTPPELDGLRRYWPTLESAKQACEDHQASYSPRPATVLQANKVTAKFIPVIV